MTNLFTLVLTLLLPIGALGTVLGNAVAVMADRSFKTLQTVGLTQDLIPTRTDYRCLFRNANNAVYNPVTEEILFIGAPKVGYFKWVMKEGCEARDTGSSWSFPIYDVKRDTFFSGPVNPFFADGAFDGAAYDRLVLDPATGDMIFCATMDSLLKYDAAAKTWSRLAVPGNGNKKIEAAAYFPEMGGIAVVSDTGTVSLFDFSKNQWRILGAVSGGLYKLAEYSPVLHAVLLTGGRGSTRLWKLDASGAITTLNNSPFQMDVTQCLLTCDPASGDYLALRYDSLYAYDMVAQVWASIKQTPGAPNFSPQKAVAVSLTGLGAVAFLTALPWPFILYKHGSTIAIEKGRTPADNQASMSCRPNPFNPESHITFSLSVSGHVNLSVYDLSGRLVKTLVSGIKNAGRHGAVWNGTNAEGRKVSTGVYLYRMTSPGRTLQVRSILAQ